MPGLGVAARCPPAAHLSSASLLACRDAAPAAAPAPARAARRLATPLSAAGPPAAAARSMVPATGGTPRAAGMAASRPARPRRLSPGSGRELSSGGRAYP